MFVMCARKVHKRIACIPHIKCKIELKNLRVKEDF